MRNNILIPTFIFLFLIAFSMPVHAYYDIDSYADAFLDQYNPNSNFPSSIGITVTSLTGNNQRGIYAFNLSVVPYGETIIGAEVLFDLVTYTNNTSIYLNIYNTSYFNEYNVTWNNQPSLDVLQTNKSVGITDLNMSVLDAVIHSHTNNESAYFILKTEENTTVTYQRTYWAREAGGGKEPTLRVYTASGSGCNVSDDYYTGSVCLDYNTYYTSDGCNYVTNDCPTGSLCTQVTPQVNVTTDLIENYTDCQVFIGGALAPTSQKINCINVCFGDTVVYSTCYDDGCKFCGDNNGGWTLSSAYGYWTNTYTTDSPTVSVPQYTVACINSTTGATVQVIDNLGNNTTIVDLLQQSGNNVTFIEPNDDAVISQSDEGTAGLKDWLNAGMGSSYGSDIIALIVAGVCAILVFINVREQDKSSSIMFGTFLLVASVFAFVGLLTPWFLMMELLLIGVVIFWKTKDG